VGKEELVHIAVREAQDLVPEMNQYSVAGMAGDND